MTTSYAQRSYTVQPGETWEIFRQSDFVTCLEGSTAFKLRINESPASTFQAGLTFRPTGGVQRVQVENTTADPLIVSLGFGLGNIEDARLSLPGGTVPTRPQRKEWRRIDAPEIGQIEVLAPANPSRDELIVENPTPYSVSIVDEVGLLGDILRILEPGDSFVVQCSNAIRFRSNEVAQPAGHFLRVTETVFV